MDTITVMFARGDRRVFRDDRDGGLVIVMRYPTNPYSPEFDGFWTFDYELFGHEHWLHADEILARTVPALEG